MRTRTGAELEKERKEWLKRCCVVGVESQGAKPAQHPESFQFLSTHLPSAPCPLPASFFPPWLLHSKARRFQMLTTSSLAHVSFWQISWCRVPQKAFLELHKVSKEGEVLTVWSVESQFLIPPALTLTQLFTPWSSAKMKREGLCQTRVISAEQALLRVTESCCAQ